MDAPNEEIDQFVAAVDEMANSMSSVREVIKSLSENPSSLDINDGISLLSLKHHIMLSYLQSLVLVSSRRALGHSLQIRSAPIQPFSAADRSARGDGAGDLVDSMVEGRVVLEKIKTLENKMRYQLERLVRVAGETEQNQNPVDDPLAFRPNPQSLMGDKPSDRFEDEDSHPSQKDDYADVSIDLPLADGIYHPPRLAPMPYAETSKSRSRKERPPLPSALASLLSDPSRPHVESTTGLGSTPSLASGRAAYLKRLNEFEENNFSRVMMKKSDAKRRARDEEDLALGGSLGGGRNRRRAGGLGDEFDDVLKSVSRTAGRSVGGGKGDGYDELRKKGKKGDALERSRVDNGTRNRDSGFGSGVESDGGGRMRKRSRFELETKTAKKKLVRDRRKLP